LNVSVTTPKAGTAVPPPPELEGIDLGAPATIGNPVSVRVPPDPVFSAARLDEIRDRLFSLRDHWHEHSPGFFTLGLAHYKGAGDASIHDVQESNVRLRAAFGRALDDLRAFLSRELGGDFEWGAGLPLPGFHILDARALPPGQPAGDSHFDLQYSFGRFDGPVRATISVTVPVQVPAAGATFEHWPVDYAELRRLICDGELADIADAERRLPMETVRYEPGKACLQIGLPLHRMGAVSSTEASDYRVTLQGHAALVGDRWIGYW
jgi:hypothetical protein